MRFLFLTSAGKLMPHIVWKKESLTALITLKRAMRNLS